MQSVQSVRSVRIRADPCGPCGPCGTCESVRVRAVRAGLCGLVCQSLPRPYTTVTIQIHVHTSVSQTRAIWAPTQNMLITIMLHVPERQPIQILLQSAAPQPVWPGLHLHCGTCRCVHTHIHIHTPRPMCKQSGVAGHQPQASISLPAPPCRETAHTNTTAECCTPTSLAWSAPPPRCPPVHPSGHHSNTSFIR